MDFSSLVLMEKDKETGFISKELGSFQVSEGALFVKKLYVRDEIVNIYFDTNKDVEEWEYSAIYDVFNYEAFSKEEFDIEDILDEYNPTFLIKFKYVDDYEFMKERLTRCVELIEDTLEEAFNNIEGKMEEYI
ncbi:hypothetical protein [Clostridium tertium]|uniref:Uncharacterized protein n=1 Tax=Clostridium tertium TaxID=1559 RepID=A0A6N3EPH3_9CLOT